MASDFPWVLDEVEVTDKVRIFRIRTTRDGYGLMESTLLVETCGYLTIMGDLCPGHHSATTPPGYTLDWFARNTTPEYLREKFLPTGWHEELARAELDALVAEDPERFDGDPGDEWADSRDETVRALHGLIDDRNEYGFGEWFMDNGFEAEEIPGYGACPRDMRVLLDIQRRFARLWRERGEAPDGQ